MKGYAELLENSLLLRCLSQEEVYACLQDGCFCIRTYGRHNIIHFSGEACRKLEIIISGQVSVERIDEAGNLMTIAEFYAGEILGGNLLFSKLPQYPMTITARQPTVLIEIDRDCLLKLLSASPAFLKCYLEFAADHTAILGDRIKHYVGKTIRACIVDYLKHEKEKQGSDIILLPITKRAWAERLGVSRTSLSRELRKMALDGLIRYDSKAVELLSIS